MIHFRLINIIKGLSLKDTVRFKLKLTHSLKIEIFQPKKNSENLSSYCKAYLSIEPNNKVTPIFYKILENEFKEDLSVFKSYTEFSKNDKQIIVPPLNHLPQSFISFANQIEVELKEAISIAVKNIRWVCNIDLPHSPISHKSFSFSFDEKIWYPMPTSISIRISFPSLKNKIERDENKTINKNLVKNIDEPIHHSLFREAWELKSFNHRSSLLLAITSIEVALKFLIVQHIPNSKWLVQNIQNPPIYNILIEYIPMLPIKNKRNNKLLLPPKAFISKLKIWVKLRNDLTHLGKDQLKGDELSNMLLSVKDILHIIDFNCGYSWALAHIRPETLNEIDKENKKAK